MKCNSCIDEMIITTSQLDLQKKEEELEEVCKKLHETKEEVNQVGA